MNEYFETLNFEKKISSGQNAMQNYPACKDFRSNSLSFGYNFILTV